MHSKTNQQRRQFVKRGMFLKGVGLVEKGDVIKAGIDGLGEIEVRVV